MFAWFRNMKRRDTRARRLPRSNPFAARRPFVEALELRRLLTVTASVTSGVLSVKISGTDTAVITEDVDQDVIVEDSTGKAVLADGPASTINSIAVTSSGTNDITDLTELGQSKDFANLATIDIGAGTGAQTLLSGSISTSGDQTYDSGVTLKGNTNLTSTGGNLDFASTVDGNFQLGTSAKTSTFGGTVGSTAMLASLLVNAGTTDLNGGSVETSGVQSYSEAVVLTADTTLTSDADSIVFLSTVDSAANGPFSLTANAAVGVNFDGLVGSNDVLNSLTTGSPGTTAINGGAVTTTGAQTYGDNVTLGAANTTLTSTASAGIAFEQKLDGASALTVKTAGLTTFGGAVGGTQALASITTDFPGSTAINGGAVTTAGAQNYADTVTLGAAATTLTSTNGGGVTFVSTLDGASALTIDTAGTTLFINVVGGITPLASITTDAPGTTEIDGGTMTTTGAQTYGDAVTLDADTTFTSTAGGGIAFQQTLDSGVEGPSALVVKTAGITTFGGVVGGIGALSTLTTDSPGTTAINGGSVTTAGSQTYGDNVTLGAAATTLTSTTSGAISFAQKLDGASALTVNTSGAATFGGVVGGVTSLASLTTDAPGSTAINGGAVTTTGGQNYDDPVTLGAAATTLASTSAGEITFSQTLDGASALTVTTAGATTFFGAVGGTTPLVSLTTSNAGTTAVQGGLVHTSGLQRYQNALTLGGDTTFTSDASSLSFLSTVNGASALSANAATSVTFGGAVGTATALSTLTVSGGAVDLNAGTIHTSGGQAYFPAVTLTTNMLLISDTADVVFGSSIDGAFSLTISAAQGASLNGAVGGTTPLSSLSVSVGATSLGGPVATTGNQSYQGPVTLLNSVTLTTRGGSVSFAGTIDGTILEGRVPTPVALTIDTTNGGTAPTGGLVQFAGDIGDTVPLSTLTVTAAGPLTIAHRITTIANQLLTVVPSSSATGALTVAAGGSLSTKAAVELRSGGNLTIAAGSSITAAGITLRGDFNNTNPAAASIVLLAGNLQSPTVAVFTGDGNTMVDVARTLANTATTITGGAGTDTYNLSSAAPATNGVLATLAGAMTINGGSGANTLVLGDGADVPGLPGTLTGSVITGFGMANGISYSNLQNIVFQLSAGAGEALSIVSTSAGTAIAVNGGQTVVLGGSPGGLDQILSSLAINGTTVLDVNDQLSTTSHTYDVSAGFFVRTGTGASNLAVVNSADLPGQVGVALANVKNININGGSGNNTYNVFLPLAPGQSVVIRGGGGTDNDVNVIGSTAGPNTVYVGNIGSGDPIQIGGVDCLTMYGAPNQQNVFVNQTAVRSILIGGLLNDTLVGGLGPDVLFGGAGNDVLIAGGTAGLPGTDYTFADLLPAYLSNGMLNPNVADATAYPGQPGTKLIDGGGGVVVYFNSGTGVVNASSVTFMQCDLPGSRALLQTIFNQALASNECLATLTSPPARPGSVATQAMLVDYSPYVQQAYEDTLGRPADPASLAYWSGQLAGGLPRSSFTNALTHSDEYYRRLIAGDYQTYLGRPIDSSSLYFWANEFEHGLSDQQFESVLLGSDEFFSRREGDTGWINALYQALLGRSADPQSEAYWNNQLQSGASRQAIAYQIATSAEAFAIIVVEDYQQYLGRAPAASEVNYWVAQLQSGQSNESLIASFVASDEFFSST